jgi:opacity protein-like surface antigen
MKRLVPAGCAIVLIVLGASGAEAQQVRRVEPRNAISFNIGYFALRGEESRHVDDVLLADLPAHVFEIDDFNFATFGGEYQFGLGEYLEGGVGIGFYQRGVPTFYADFETDTDAFIDQEFKLRIVPMTATIKFLPIGRGPVEPYIGVGVGLFNWEYSEVGDFIDFSDDTVFHAQYNDSGNEVGPVIFGGIRFPVADIWTFGGELRYQKAEADLDPNVGFLGTKIDLGGWTTSFNVSLRF